MYSPFKVLSNEQAKSVNPTTTVLVDWFETGPADILSGQIKNNDGSQVLQGSIIASWNGTDESTTEWFGLNDIQPGESRSFSVSTGRHRYLKIVGTASGAGLSAKVSAELSLETGITRGGPR